LRTRFHEHLIPKLQVLHSFSPSWNFKVWQLTGFESVDEFMHPFEPALLFIQARPKAIN